MTKKTIDMIIGIIYTYIIYTGRKKEVCLCPKPTNTMDGGTKRLYISVPIVNWFSVNKMTIK